ncbi:MAG: TolC family protein [Bacteroidaceae bacterium]|nr:TolC family protein [Bacteroidaceae bacterium]
MRRKDGLLFAAACLMGLSANAQQWDLKQCIDYAMAHNIQLQQNRISEQQAEIDLLTSKAQLFPSLSFSTSQNLSNSPWRETINYTTESGSMSTSSTSYSGNYGLTANWTVWNGGKRHKNIEASKISVELSELTSETNANTIQEQIMQYYVQILYAKESVKVNESTLEVAKAQRDRAKERVELGDLSIADLAQLEAQVASGEYNIVNAKSQVEKYKMQLKQLLELTGNADFDIATISVTDEQAMNILPSVTSVYEQALITRPEIRSSQLNIDAANLNVDIAKAGKMPTISMNANIGSNTSSANKNGWGKQFKSNWGNNIGLSVSIPILSQRQNRSAVEKAKYQVQASQLDLQNQQKLLYNTIEGYWIDGTTAQEQFKSSLANVKSMQTSFDLLSEQFDLGLKNIVELMDARNNLLQAEQSKLQCKYTVIMNEQLLKFYSGESTNL